MHSQGGTDKQSWHGWLVASLNTKTLYPRSLISVLSWLDVISLTYTRCTKPNCHLISPQHSKNSYNLITSVTQLLKSQKRLREQNKPNSWRTKKQIFLASQKVLYNRPMWRLTRSACGLFGVFESLQARYKRVLTARCTYCYRGIAIVVVVAVCLQRCGTVGACDGLVRNQLHE